MATTPNTHPDVYKGIVVNGTESPGTVTLSGYPRERKWQQDSPSGMSGEFTKDKGPKNSGFTATFYLADLEDVEAWDGFARMLLESLEGPKPRALFVTHPDLMRNRMIDFVLQSIGDMTHDGKGGATVVCKFLEYRPPKPKPVAKPGAAQRRGTTTVNDPNAARKAELAALLEQAKQP